MKLKTTVILTVLMLLFGAVSETPADRLEDSPEVVSLYNRGKRMLREGDWLEASRIFEELAGRYPQSANIDLFLFNRAKADYYFGDYNKALAGFNNFTLRFSQSPYFAYALFFQANIYYARGDVDRAVNLYIRAYARTDDRRLEALVEGSLRGAITHAGAVTLSADDFSEVPRGKRCPLIKSVSEVLLEREEFVTARDLMALCGEKLDLSANERYRAGLRDGTLDIAVVLPLSGDLQAFGEDIYNGAVIAADMYRQESGGRVNLTTYDTKGDPINAARIIRNLADSPTDIVLGPLTSEEAAVASATLNCSNLPLMAPAATQAGLTALSETSFQLSPNIELQGIQMADYAVNNLEADTAAIITPTGTDDLRMSRAFAERFEKLGGKVIAVEYYRTRDKDFSKYIKDIKAMLLGAHPDSVFFIDERGDTLDSDGLPAHVDCLFLPGKASQLRLLLAQINFYNLNGFYLGSDGWGDDEVYRLGDAVTKGAVFPSPFIPGRNSEENLKFSTAYDARFAQQPPRLASLGYDAVRIITNAAQKAGTGRETLTSEIGRIREYSGAAGKVSFGRSRENIAMPVYKIENDQAVLLGIGGATGVPATETARMQE